MTLKFLQLRVFFCRLTFFSELKGLCVYLQVSTAIKSMGTECCWSGFMGRSWLWRPLLKTSTRASSALGTWKLQVHSVNKYAINRNLCLLHRLFQSFTSSNVRLSDKIRLEAEQVSSKRCTISWRGTLQYLQCSHHCQRSISTGLLQWNNLF